jgi:hypothetical protein
MNTAELIREVHVTEAYRLDGSFRCQSDGCTFRVDRGNLSAVEADRLHAAHVDALITEAA